MKQIQKCTGLVIAIFAGLFLTACSELFPDLERTMQLARDHLESGDSNAAAIELRNALTDSPDNAEARYLLASIYLDFGDYASADKEFKRALDAGWDNGEATYGLVRSQLGLGKFREVVSLARLQDNWSAEVSAAVLATRALANMALGKGEAAFADLESAQALDATSAIVLRAGIQLQIVEGDRDSALDALRRALERYPDNAELLLLQAGMVAGQDPALAEKNYRAIIAQDKGGFISANGRIARLQLVQLQILSEQFDQAEEMLGPMYRRDHRDPFTNYLGGLIAFRKDDYQRASELLLKVLKLAPEHNPTRLLFGTVNYAEKNYEQAAYFLSKYVAAVPDNLLARKLLARSYILLGRNSEASTVLQSALESEKNDAELLALAGMSELKLGRTAAGLAGLEQAVSISPGSTGLRSELARAYIEAGEPGLAIKELQKMLAEGGEQRQTETLLVLAYLREGDFSQAIDLVLDSVSRYPDDPAVFTLAGTVFAASDDLQEAREYFTLARSMQAGFPPATMSLAHLEEKAGNYEQASLLYEQVVESGTKSVVPMLALARVAEQQGDKQALLGWLERALQAFPADLSTRTFLAEYHLREGNLLAAGSFVREALEMVPDEPSLLALSGRISIAGGKFHKALQPLQALVKARPDSVTARVLLGECYLQLGELDQARGELQSALERDPANVSVMAMFAKLEIKAAAYDKALEYSRKIQAAYPELFLGYELAGDSFMVSERFAEAEDEYLQAWERLPSAGLVIKRAENADRSGQPDKAAGLLEAWLESRPDDTEVAQFLATSLQNAGRIAEATTVYEKVIATEPENPVALNNLAGLYLAANRPEALELAKRAWMVAENNPGVQDTYGWALVQAGQVGRGLQLLKEALKSLPVPEVRYHHAVALYRAGNKNEARKLLGALLKEDVAFEGKEEAQQLMQE